jgi:hypothetical protein
MALRVKSGLKDMGKLLDLSDEILDQTLSSTLYIFKLTTGRRKQVIDLGRAD